MEFEIVNTVFDILCLRYVFYGHIIIDVVVHVNVLRMHHMQYNICGSLGVP